MSFKIVVSSGGGVPSVSTASWTCSHVMIGKLSLEQSVDNIIKSIGSMYNDDGVLVYDELWSFGCESVEETPSSPKITCLVHSNRPKTIGPNFVQDEK